MLEFEINRPLGSREIDFLDFLATWNFVDLGDVLFVNKKGSNRALSDRQESYLANELVQEGLPNLMSMSMPL